VPVIVRPSTPQDAPELAEVAALTFGLACPPSTTEDAKDDFLSNVLSESNFDAYLADPGREVIVVADDSGPILGYTMLVLGDPSDDEVASAISIRPTIELSKCYVLATHHSSGAAARLMQATLETAVRLGCAGVWLGVNVENQRAQRFYAKHGFVRVGTKHFLLGGQLEDDWVMERAL
jgi:ribosomal protein S18 acetylase RimI-like enzyme